MRNISEVLGGFFMAVAFGPYILDILRGRVRPHRLTWVAWAAPDTLAGVSMLYVGTVNAQIAVAVVCAWSIVLLSLKYGQSGWEMRDKVSLILCLLGVVLAIAFQSGMVGILSACVVLLIGSDATLRDVWHKPYEHTVLPWCLWVTSCVFTLLSITDWSISGALQAVTFGVIDVTILTVLLVRRVRVARPVSS